MKFYKRSFIVIFLCNFLILDCFVAPKQKTKTPEQKKVRCLFGSSNPTLFSKAYEVIIKAFIPVVKDKNEQEAEKYLREKYAPWYKKYCGLLKEKKAFLHCYKNNKNNVVATILFSPIQDSNKAYIEKLAVKPGYQRNGVGKRLIFSIFRRYPKIKKIELHTLLSNEKAQRFYQRLGFRRGQKFDNMVSFSLERE